MTNPEKLLSDYWTTCSLNRIPDSTEIHSDFKQLALHGKFLDIGCGIGRKSIELRSIGLDTVGVDLNRSALIEGIASNNSLVQSSADYLPFRNGSFDGAIIPGVLSIVSREQRYRILEEALRCIKPRGLIYVTDFKKFTKPENLTSDGKRWSDVYEQDFSTTGEFGSVIVNNPDGSPRFISHHFGEDEIVKIMEALNVEILGNKLVEVRSQVSGEEITTINIWGRK